MKTESINKYVGLGTCIRYLQDADVTFGVYADEGLLRNIYWFFEALTELDMNVTFRYASELRKFQEKLELDREKNRNLTDSECKKLGNIMTEIRKVFEAEAQGVFAFITTEKRFDIKKLLNNVGKIFAPDTFDELPEIAQYVVSHA